MENGKHWVYNLPMDTVDPKYLLEKLNIVFGSLISAVELKIAFGFVLKNVEDGTCRYEYAHKNITLMERSKLVTSTEELTKIRNLLSNTDVIESCTGKRAFTKWKFYKLTKVTTCAALPKEIPMGCEHTVLPDPPLKSHSAKCLTLEQNTRKPYKDTLCFFIDLALHLNGIKRQEEEISKIFIFFLKKASRIDPANFRCVCVEDIAAVEDIVEADISFYDFDIVEDLWLGSLRGGVSRIILLLYSYCVLLVTFAVFPRSCLSSKPNVVHREMISSQELQTWSVIWVLAQEELNNFLQIICINCEKHCLTKETRSISFTQMTKCSLRTWQFSNLSQFVCRKINCDTDSALWIGKDVQLSVSTLSNLVEQPIFLCNSNLGALVESFADALDGLGTQTKTQMNMKFSEIETSVRS